MIKFNYMKSNTPTIVREKKSPNAGRTDNVDQTEPDQTVRLDTPVKPIQLASKAKKSDILVQPFIQVEPYDPSHVDADIYVPPDKSSRLAELFLSHPIVLTRNISNGYGFDSWGHAIWFMKTYTDVYEMYRIQPVKPYIDYETDVFFHNDDTESYDTALKAFEDRMRCEEKRAIDRLRVVVMHIFTSVFRLQIDQSNILFASGSRWLDDSFYKISIHMIVNSMYYFESVKEAGLFASTAKIIASHLEGDDIMQYHQRINASVERNAIIKKTKGDASDDMTSNNTPKHPIDMSVYTRLQQFRCVFSSKSNSTPLIPVDLSHNPIDKDRINFADYAVTHRIRGYQIIDIGFLKDVPEDAEIDRIADKGVSHVFKDKILTQTTMGIKQIQNTYEITNDAIVNIERPQVLKAVTSSFGGAVYGGYKHVGGNILYDFNYNHVEACPVTGKNHDRLGFYAFVDKNKNVFIACRSAQCRRVTGKRTKPVKKQIGSIYNKSYFDEEHDTNTNIDVTLKTLMRNQDIGEIETPDHTNVLGVLDKFVNSDDIKGICIRSAYGTGKTYALKHIISALEKKGFKRFLWITHRRLFALDVQSRFPDFAIYFDISKYADLNSESKLMISVESLYRLFNGNSENINERSLNTFYKYNALIIDESESVISQMYSPTHKRNKLDTFYDFKTFIMGMCKKIICLDADLDSKTMTLMRDYKTLSINNRYRSADMKLYKIIYDDTKKFTQHEAYFINQIVEDLKAGKNIAIVVLGAKYGRSLRDNIISMMPSIKDHTLYHYSDGSDEDMTILKEVNGKKGWASKRLLIYSPILGAGIDFNLEHFDRIYSYITASTDPANYLQLCNRIRKVKDNTIVCLLNKSMSKNIHVPLFDIDDAMAFYKYIDTSMAKRRRVVIYEDEHIIKTEMSLIDPLESHEKLYRDIGYYQILIELNKRKYNYVTTLNTMLIQKGSSLEFAKFRAGNKTLVNLQKDVAIATIKTAGDITEADYNKLIGAISKTEDEKKQIDRFQIARHLHVNELTNEMIDDYYKTHTIVRDIVKYIDVNENRTVRPDKDIETKKLDKKHDVFNRILKIMGVTYLVDTTITPDVFADDEEEEKDETVNTKIGAAKPKGKTKTKTKTKAKANDDADTANRDEQMDDVLTAVKESAETEKKGKFGFIDNNTLILFGIRSSSDKMYPKVKAICEHFGMMMTVVWKTKRIKEKMIRVVLGYSITYYTNAMNIVSLLSQKENTNISQQNKTSLAKYNKYHDHIGRNGMAPKDDAPKDENPKKVNPKKSDIPVKKKIKRIV